MHRVARAFAPGNISGVFKIIEHEDPSKMHSLGLGFTVAHGATVKVNPSDSTVVIFNGSPITMPTIVDLLKKLTSIPVRVQIETPLPLSSGFGLSGASALATAYGLNRALDLGLPPQQLALAAHTAEVENLTGLGDVCAQFHGGCLMKLHPGEPLCAQTLPLAEQDVYYRYFGPIDTRQILSDVDARQHINDAADRALESLGQLAQQEAVDFDRCVRISKQFAQDSGLLQHEGVRSLIADIEHAGGAASMIMLGNAVFSSRPFERSQKTRLSTQSARVEDCSTPAECRVGN